MKYTDKQRETATFTCPECGGHKFRYSEYRVYGERLRHCASGMVCNFAWPADDDSVHLILAPKNPHQRFLDAVRAGKNVWCKQAGREREGLLCCINTSYPNTIEYTIQLVNDPENWLLVEGVDIPLRPTQDYLDKYGFTLKECCRPLVKGDRFQGWVTEEAAFLNSKPLQFTDDEIKQMIVLCHPDKHGGSKSAHDITARLLSMRRKSSNSKLRVGDADGKVM